MGIVLKKIRGMLSVKRIVAVSTAAALVVSLIFLSTCDSASKKSTYEEIKLNPYTPASDRFVPYAENDELILSVNETTAEFAVTNKSTGYTWYSQPQDALESDFSGDQLNRGRSMLSVAVVKKNSDNYEYILYNDCLVNNQYEIERTDNGANFRFILGIREITAADIPQKINPDKFNDRIINELDTDDKVLVKKAYKPSKLEDCIVLSTTIKQEIEAVYNILKKIGYTEEDIEEDNREFSVVSEPSHEPVYAEVKLVLDGDSLVATIPTDKLVQSDNHAIAALNFCEYLGASKQGGEGYFVIPDGSGYLIDFKNGAGSNKTYVSTVYGPDSNKVSNDTGFKQNGLYLPVFGIKKGNDAMLATVEKGAALSQVTAETMSFSSFYKIFWRLTPHKYDVSTVSEQRMLLFSEQNYREPYVIRYSFLGDGEREMTYSDLAKKAQSVLFGDEKKETGNYGFSLNALASVNRQTSFAGIPLRTDKVSFSYDELLDSCRELKSGGIDSMSLSISGWLKGGLSHDSPVSALRLSGALGGVKGLEKLILSLGEIGIEPNMNVSVTNVFHGVQSRHLAKNILGQASKNFLYRYDTLEVNGTFVPTGFINPLSLGKATENIIKSGKDFKFGNLRLDDIGSYNYSSGRSNDFVDKDKAAELTSEAIKKLSESFGTVEIENGYYYALKFAGRVTGLDITGSRNSIFTESVPFVPLVLNGRIEYTFEPYNLSSNSGFLRLKTAETGAGLYFKFSGDQEAFIDTEYNSLYSTGFGIHKETALRLYNEYRERLGDVKDSAVKSHKKLADGVYLTVFDNGYGVVTNYNDSDYSYGDTTVPGMDYGLVRGVTE